MSETQVECAIRWWHPYPSPSALRADLRLLLAVVEAARACHGHGPTGRAPRVGYCALCDAIEAVTTDPAAQPEGAPDDR